MDIITDMLITTAKAVGENQMNEDEIRIKKDKLSEEIARLLLKDDVDVESVFQIKTISKLLIKFNKQFRISEIKRIIKWKQLK